MILLRELNGIAMAICSADGILAKSGWDISNQFSTMESFSDSPFHLSYTCDLSDAYSNCTLDDVKQILELLLLYEVIPGSFLFLQLTAS